MPSCTHRSTTNADANLENLRLVIHDLGIAPSHSASTMEKALSIRLLTPPIYILLTARRLIYLESQTVMYGLDNQCMQRIADRAVKNVGAIHHLPPERFNSERRLYRHEDATVTRTQHGRLQR